MIHSLKKARYDGNSYVWSEKRPRLQWDRWAKQVISKLKNEASRYGTDTFFTDGNLFVIICTQFSTSAERAVGGRGACSRNIISLALQTPRVGTHTTNTRLEKILEQTHPWHPTSAGNFRHIYHLLFCTRPLKCSAKMILPLKLVLIFTKPILGGREFFDQKLHLAQVRLLRPDWGWAIG